MSAGKKKGWSKKKKIILGSIVAVIVLVILFFALGNKGDMNLMVSTMPLSKTNLEETITLKAPLEGTESVEVVSQLNYEVAELLVKEGDKVTKGQILAVLDGKKMKEEIQQAADALALDTKQYQEGLENSQRAYDKAVEDLKAAKANYDRVQSLYDQGADTLVSLEGAKTTLADAQRQVDSYNTAGGKVVGNASTLKQLEISKKELERKKEALADLEIKSLIDGIVSRINVKVGSLANDTNDGKPMFIIDNTSQLQMTVKVSEYDIGKIVVGQNVTISADILQGATVKGVVARISPTGELKDTNSTERVIPTQINITEGSDKLIAGITATAEISIAQADHVFAVPLGALIQNADDSVSIATVTEENTLHLIPVTVGLETDLEAEISGEDLTEGMQVVTNPNSQMSEAMPVMAPAVAE